MSDIYKKMYEYVTMLSNRIAAVEQQERRSVGMITTWLPSADDVRIMPGAARTVVQDFASTTPSGWSWAGTPFSTPTVSIINGTWLRQTGMSGSERTFFSRSLVDQSFYNVIASLDTNNNGFYSGVRLDDGSDNNYVELVWWYSTSGSPIRVYLRQRTGGGTVTETDQTTLANAYTDRYTWLVLQIGGARWSSWTPTPIINGLHVVRGTNGSTVTWTPTRIGIVTQFSTQSWQSSYVDCANF